jgi:protease-4
VYLTGSASIGSIGTYLAFLNPAIAMKMQGYSMEIFSQGTHKGLGVPGREITQADRAYLQKTVDDLNAQFVAAVKSGRADVSEDAITSAKMYPGRDAVSQGLADGIVSGWDEMISLL